MRLIDEIHTRLPSTHLAMHGSSSVPRGLVKQISRYGGQMKEGRGVAVEEIQLGIRHGGRKINVDTDSRLAITGAIRKHLAEHPDEVDPRSYLTPTRAAMQVVIEQRTRAFGQEGQAGVYTLLTVDAIRERYAEAL